MIPLAGVRHVGGKHLRCGRRVETPQQLAGLDGPLHTIGLGDQIQRWVPVGLKVQEVEPSNVLEVVTAEVLNPVEHNHQAVGAIIGGRREHRNARFILQNIVRHSAIGPVRAPVIRG